MYILVATDMSHLGGPMGTEYTTTMFQKFFHDRDNAVTYAEQHFQDKTRERFKRFYLQTEHELVAEAHAKVGVEEEMSKFLWTQNEASLRSPDLGWVQYRINEVTAEDEPPTPTCSVCGLVPGECEGYHH